MKDRDSFIFYKSYFQAGQVLDIEDRVKYYELIILYGFNPDNLTGFDEFPPMIKAMFPLIKPTMDKNYQLWLNGCKGGRPKNSNSASQNNQTETKPKPNNNQTKTKAEPTPSNDVAVAVAVAVAVDDDFKKETNKAKKATPAASFKLKDCLNLFLPNDFKHKIWYDWCTYKASIKDPYKTERGAKAAITAIYNLSNETGDSIEILINHAIDREWKGVHKINSFSNNNKNDDNEDNEDTFEDDSQYENT